MTVSSAICLPPPPVLSYITLTVPLGGGASLHLYINLGVSP